VRRPLVLTQYDDAMNLQVAGYLRASGVEPRATLGLGCRNAAEVNAKTAADYERLAREALAAHPDADAIFLAARTNLFDVAQRLERERGIPVVDQAQATVWWSLAQLAVTAPADRGRLLSSSPALPIGAA
jgi:maleate cis-trans isomerase